MLYCKIACLNRGDSVSNTETEVSVNDGSEVTLRCSYSTSNNNVYLFWYRKYPNQAMQYILDRGARSRSGSDSTADFAKKRFSSTADQDFTELSISALTLQDSAIYHCALLSTV
uniref:Ig-like domain-containing protein n=1 Tax=Erpetoichthys calabaricus TaxID=27687 RepID=A0A8C4RXW1_ERPCA